MGTQSSGLGERIFSSIGRGPGPVLLILFLGGFGWYIAGIIGGEVREGKKIENFRDLDDDEYHQFDEEEKLWDNMTMEELVDEYKTMSQTCSTDVCKKKMTRLLNYMWLRFLREGGEADFSAFIVKTGLSGITFWIVYCSDPNGIMNTWEVYLSNGGDEPPNETLLWEDCYNSGHIGVIVLDGLEKVIKKAMKKRKGDFLKYLKKKYPNLFEQM